MSDIKLNNQGDIDISDGKLSLLNTREESQTQRLGIALQLYRGEWYLNLAQGVPYFQQILVKGTSQNIVDNLIRSEILAQPDIVRIESFQSEIENNTYSLIFRAVTNSGDIINLNQSIQV